MPAEAEVGEWQLWRNQIHAINKNHIHFNSATDF
jgi:hypothetical protein